MTTIQGFLEKIKTEETVTVTLPASSFQDQLFRVAPAAATQSYLPELLMVRLTTEGGLQAQATDSFWGVTCTVPCEEDGYLDVLVPAKRLNTLAQTFPPDQPVKLTMEGATLVVRCARSVTHHHTADPESFPRFPEGLSPILTCSGERLKLAADLTAWAASRGDERPVFKNVHVVVNEDGQVRFESTDGFVVALWDGFTDTAEPNLVVTQPTDFLVPARVLAQFGKIAGGRGQHHIDLAVAGEDPTNPNHVVLDASRENFSIKVASRCMEGVFPDLKAHLDHHLTRGREMPTFAQATVKAQDVTRVLARILPYASSISGDSKPVGGKHITLTVAPGEVADGLVALRCETQEGEQAYDAVEGETVGTGTVTLGSDLLDNAMDAVVRADQEGMVTLNVPSPIAPVTFVPAGVPGFVGLISPIAEQGGQP
jgi:DNA polymerase III sliding clamp (beta) subunit (PCNA family)